MPTKQTPAGLLIACGEALYGSRWQTDLSEELEVADRTMRRWLAGDTPIPPGLWVDLTRLMMGRAHTLDALVERCKRAGAP
jgi:hypothetical protein